MKEELLKYFKMNLKSFIILVYLKALRLYSVDSLSIQYFNKPWFISTGSTLFSLTLNNLLGTKISSKLIKIYDEKHVRARETLTTAFSIFFVLFLKYLYMRIFFGKNIVNSKYIQVTIISILSITFYSIVFKPFFDNSHHSRFLNSIISDTILLLSSDFIEDAKIDSKNFDIEVNTIGTLFRIIVNSIIKI